MEGENLAINKQGSGAVRVCARACAGFSNWRLISVKNRYTDSDERTTDRETVSHINGPTDAPINLLICYLATSLFKATHQSLDGIVAFDYVKCH